MSNLFFQVDLFFTRLQIIRATASSENNSFREFRENIKVTKLHNEIQKTASEVFHKMLFELEKEI